MKEAALIAQGERPRLERRIKHDGSIATSGDDKVEVFLRAELGSIAPGAGFWGEESGFEPPAEAGLWLVDPIDGTSNFSYGSPLWGISVALLRDGEIMLGAIALPDLGELYLAEAGVGVTCNGAKLDPIPPGEVHPTHLVSFNEHVAKHAADFPIPGKMRCAGAFVMDAAFVVRQRYRGLIGFREKLYDIAASVLMARELGADIRYADGSRLVIDELLEDRMIGRPWIIFPRGSGFFLR